MVADVSYRTNILRREEDADNAKPFDVVQRRMVSDVSIDDLYGSLMAKEDRVLAALKSVADASSRETEDRSTSAIQVWDLTRKAVGASFQLAQLASERDFMTLWGLMYSDHEFRIAIGVAIIVVTLCATLVMWT